VPDDDTSANRDIVLRVLGVFNTGDMAVLDELVAADFVNHNAPPGAPQGLDGRKRTVAMFRTAFSDLRSTIEEVIAYGDRVVTRASLSGTNDGDFMGRSPTGRSMRVTAIDIFRVADGVVTDRWGVLDMASLTQQLQADG
jgi:predicted ester cyclase